MKICLDARNPSYGGTYTYIVSLLNAISEIETSHPLGNEYLVLYDDFHGALGLPGLQEKVIPHHKSVRMILWNRFQLGPLLEVEGVDIYHSLKLPSLPSTRARTLYTIHATTHFLYPELWKRHELIYWRWGTRQKMRRGDGIIAVSPVEKENLVRYVNVDPGKVFVIPLAPQPRFKPVTDQVVLERTKKALGLPDQFVLFVGNIYPFKNVDNIVRAFHKAVQEASLPHKLVLAGGHGNRSQEVFALIGALGLQERVIIPGFVKDELPALYTLADLFLFPSIYESFGLPPLEAMSCGTPVITSTAGALPDVTGEAAIQVDPFSVDELSEAIVQVLLDRQLHQDLACRGIQRAAEFNWGRTARETLAVYQHVFQKG